MDVKFNSLPKVQNLTEPELQVLTSMIQKMKLDGNFTALDDLWKIDYDEIPVSIDRFLEDDHYMGKVFQNGELIYPFWRNELRYIFEENPDNAFEIVISGAIGTGKSTISAIGMTYLIYRTLCLKDPQKFYGLTANSPIVFVCLNLTLELAYSGLYSMIVESIKLSPWFCERVDIRGRYDFSIEFPKGVALMAGSNVQHTIGKNVLGAILDELNFSNAPKGSKNSVLDMYRNIRRRMESRFLRQGRIPGFLFLVSSKNTEMDFLEQYIQTIKHNKTTYVIDKAVYDIKPPETYVGTKFKVAVGDKTKSSRILYEDEDIELIESQGYKIIEVPTEYKIAFEQDINDALKDISGINSVSTSKLIPYAGKIERCINYTRPSPLLVEDIILSLDTHEDIKDYLDDLRVLKKDLHVPRFGHIDIGLKNDALGFGIVHATNTTSVERYTKSGKIESFIENTYQLDLMLKLKAAQGSEVPLYKLREFILYLATTLGIKFGTITFDGFQSSDSIQLLKTAGINAGLLSVDRTDEQYLNLRSCILENRLDIYNHSTLVRELYDLEHDLKKKKVDHPLEGSKDCSDALCFSNDTKIFLLSGKDITVEELYNIDFTKEYIVACDTENKQLKYLPIINVIKKDIIPEKLYKVTLDNGETFKVTEDHLILMRNGTYKEAQELCVNDSLMPFNVYTELFHKDNYRKIVDPYTNKHSFIYKDVVTKLKKHEFDSVDLSDGSKYKVIHHQDHDKTNDLPTNLMPMSLRKHRKIHGDIITKYNKSKVHRDKAREVGLKIRFGHVPIEQRIINGKNSALVTKYNGSNKQRKDTLLSRERGAYLESDKRFTEMVKSKEFVNKAIQTKRENGTLDKYKDSMTSYNKDPIIKKKQKLSKITNIYNIIRDNTELFAKDNVTYEEFLYEYNKLKSLGIINKRNSMPQSYDLIVKAGVPITNHKVVSVEIVDNVNPVYDIMLDDVHNFAIKSGVFIHNCGAVWNAQKYYADKKQTNVVQHQNVKEAAKFIADLNKKRWAMKEYEQPKDVEWLLKE